MACIILFAMHSLIWPSTTIDKGRWLVVRTSADVGGAPCHRYRPEPDLTPATVSRTVDTTPGS